MPIDTMLLLEIVWACLIVGAAALLFGVVGYTLRAIWREWKDDHDRRARRISVLKG
jgi:hypothetical protein